MTRAEIEERMTALAEDDSNDGEIDGLNEIIRDLLDDRDGLKQSIKAIVKDGGVVVSRQAKRIAELERAVEGLTAGLKYLTPEQIATTSPDATAILDVPCGAVQRALAALAEVKEV